MLIRLCFIGYLQEISLFRQSSVLASLKVSLFAGVRLAAEKKLAEPRTVDVVEMVPNKGPLGKAFKKDAKAVTDALAALDAAAVGGHEAALASEAGKFSLKVTMGSHFEFVGLFFFNSGRGGAQTTSFLVSPI